MNGIYQGEISRLQQFIKFQLLILKEYWKDTSLACRHHIGKLHIDHPNKKVCSPIKDPSDP